MELRKEVDQLKLLTRLSLIPASRYMQFSDGYRLSWKLFDFACGPDYNFSAIKDPVMSRCVMDYDNMKAIGPSNVPLDEEHWGAVIFPTQMIIELRVEGASCELEIETGQKYGPVLLRDLVNTVKSKSSEVVQVINENLNALGSDKKAALFLRVWNGIIPSSPDYVSLDRGQIEDYEGWGQQMLFHHPESGAGY